MTTNDLDAITARIDAWMHDDPGAAFWPNWSGADNAPVYIAREDVPDLVAEVRELRDWRNAVALGLGYAEQAGPFIQVADPQVIIDGIREAILGGSDPTQLLGATDVGEPGTWPLNAGEFAARWNQRTPEERDLHVRGLVDAQILAEAVRTVGLTMADHDVSYDDLLAASSVDNATRVDDPTDDAGHEHHEVTS